MTELPENVFIKITDFRFIDYEDAHNMAVRLNDGERVAVGVKITNTTGEESLSPPYWVLEKTSGANAEWLPRKIMRSEDDERK
jgi:hypothetical protein